MSITAECEDPNTATVSEDSIEAVRRLGLRATVMGMTSTTDPHPKVVVVVVV